MYLRNVLFNVSKFCTSKSVKQVTKTSNNLINPGPDDPIAFGYYFPKDWNEQKIYSLLDPMKKEIINVKIIQNKLGLSAGKVLLTFKNVPSMVKYINRYNEDFIQTEDSVHKIVLKRFQLKNQLKKRQRDQYNKKFGVHLTNLDFDIDQAELQRLAEDFGEIQFIDLPMRGNGLNIGKAKIYFKTKQQSIEFSDFSNGLLYKQRKLKCEVLKSQNELKKNQEPREVHDPKIVMKWNEDLYKRMVKKQAETKKLHQQ